MISTCSPTNCALQIIDWTFSATPVPVRVPVEVQRCSVYGYSAKLVPQEELCMKVLDGELSPECYKDHFRTLLYLEEHQRQNFLTEE